MRIESLNIPAFGHFSDFSLKFPAGGHDLHLIYGANEAGKSSLLRAIHHLFFGIPGRTPDNFRHSHSKLLIGATISEGQESLTFYRKKGRGNTLLDEGRNSLEEGALAPFLGSVNEEFFESMFGLDSESLRAGAASLLSGEGDLGTAIFSASLGGSPIDDAIKKLEAEAHTLCKGASKRGTTILPAVAAFKEAEKAARSESTSASAWRALKTEVKNARVGFEEKDKAHREHRLRWKFVESCLRAIPVLATIRDLESGLAEIDIPELASDFPARVRTVQEQITVARQKHQLQESQIKTAQAALNEVGDFEGILARAPEFEAIHRKAEQHLQNLEVLPGLKQEVDQSGYHDLSSLPLVAPADQIQLKETASRLRELNQEVGQTGRALEDLEIELKAQRGQVTEASDLSGLEDQCRRIDDFAVERSAIPGLEKKLGHLRTSREGLVARLGIEGDPRMLKVPGAKTIHKEAAALDDFNREIRELEGRLNDLRDALTEEQANLDHLAKQAALYSPTDLVTSREERDAIWATILKSKSIDESLSAAISHADEVADVLREHADHIAAAATHQGKISQLKGKMGNLETDLKRRLNERTVWEENWKLLSPNLLPVPLLEWREDWEKLCALVEEEKSLEGELAALAEKERALLKDLGGREFEEVHRRLKVALKQAHQEEGERHSVLKLISKNEVKQQQFLRQQRTLEAELAEIKQEWGKACAATLVSPDLSPVVAVELLESRLRAREILLDYESRRSAVAQYEALIRSLAERFETDPSEPALTARYEKAKMDQNRSLDLQAQLERLEEAFPGTRLALTSGEAVLQELEKQAGTSDLESVMRKMEERKALLTRLNEQKLALQNLAGATALADFIGTLEGQDATALADEKATLDQAENQLQQERDEAKAALDTHLRRQAELMKASDEAANHRQAAADALATVVADTQRFSQLQYAIDFLKQQVEDYRRKTQGPMIDRTSAIFRTLTCGAFKRVAAQLDEKEQPQLIALRKDGEPVTTSGLSEGTSDQLYLALRLAAIDLHLENHQGIPLILDDLLMTFDDERTLALLPVLEELSRKTQILIFTHHSHLKALVGPNVTTHDLS